MGGAFARLVDGLPCLAVLTETTIGLSNPKTGAILIERPLGELAGFLIDAHGRFVLHFDPGTGQSHVGSFRPATASPTAADSARQASSFFMERAVAAWEDHTGRGFTNHWLMPNQQAGR